MLLALDVGNTNISIGCIEEGGDPKIFRMAADTAKTEDEYAVCIKQILHFSGIDSHVFDGAVICSVVPPLTDTLKTAVKLLTGHSALVVGTGVKTGLNILIDNPGQLGADLAAAAVSAMSRYPLPVIIIDMGTATTISVIDKNSNYLGGALFPGVSLSVEALSSGTSLLQKIQIEAPKKCISGNTIDCMKSGAVFGTASMIDGMIDRIETELGERATLVATGEIAPKIVKHCGRKIAYDKDLVMLGLAIIYDKNKKK